MVFSAIFLSVLHETDCGWRTTGGGGVGVVDGISRFARENVFLPTKLVVSAIKIQ